MPQHIGKGMSVAFADYDGDGFMDVFVTNDAVPNFLFHNRRDGTFEEVGPPGRRRGAGEGGRPVSSMGVDFRDYDNDGRPDIVRDGAGRRDVPALQERQVWHLPRRDL